jgi:hypothetical protein
VADLDTPASRVRAALASVFGPVAAIGDGDFAAVTEIGADSGWLLAASAP